MLGIIFLDVVDIDELDRLSFYFLNLFFGREVGVVSEKNRKWLIVYFIVIDEISVLKKIE